MSIHAEEPPTGCVGSLTISCDPICEVTPLIWKPSYVLYVIVVHQNQEVSSTRSLSTQEN